MATGQRFLWPRQPSLPAVWGGRASRGPASCSRRASPCSSGQPANWLLHPIAISWRESWQSSRRECDEAAEQGVEGI